MENKKVWLITGASKGLGLTLANKLLSQGCRVAATSRTVKALTDNIISSPDNFLPLELDLTDEAAVSNAVKKAHAHFGRLDVVVNNAGYGIGGALEELRSEEIRQSFDVNVFATINVIKSAMPFLRAQGAGHIINISSIAGFAPGIGWAAYAAAKYAVIGLTEVLADDIREFGIKATVVAPGAFRTSFLSPDSLVLSKDRISEYTAVRASHNKYLHMDGAQAGDPEKAADLFISLAEMQSPPVLFFMGTDAYNRAAAKLDGLKAGLEGFKALSHATDY